MKSNTKSSITLPLNELKLVLTLQKQLRAKSKVEVIRRGLEKLKEEVDRNLLMKLYQQASEATRESTKKEIAELDHLTSEGLEEE